MKKGIKEYKAYLGAHKGRILFILLIILILILAFLILDEKLSLTGQAIKEPIPTTPMDEISKETAGYEDVVITSTT
ncbi:MAG: hypothetical protein ABIJ21_03305 [Nanoarchaeota archaeon]